MPRFQMSDSKVQAAIEFIRILKAENYFKHESVKKDDVSKLFKKFSPSKPSNLKFFEVLQYMLYIKLIKNLKNKNKDYIFFKPGALNKIIEENIPSNQQETKNSKRVPNSYSSGQYLKSVHKSNVVPSKKFANSTIAQNDVTSNYNNTRSQVKNPVPPIKPENKYITKSKCVYCDCKFYSEAQYEKHILEIAHILRQKYRTNKKSLSENMNILEFETEKDGSKVTDIQSKTNISNSITCKITNKNNYAVYEITDIILLYTQLRELTLTYKLPILLKSENSQIISINFTFRYEGTYVLPIIFKIVNKTNDKDEPKYVLKEMVFKIQPDAVNNSQPTTSFKRTTRRSNLEDILIIDNKTNIKLVSHLEDIPIIDGVRPPKIDRKGLTVRRLLGFYNLPSIMIKLINWGLRMDPNMTPQEQQRLVELRKLLNVPDRLNCLTSANYCKMLKTLLEFEEYEMQKNIRFYDCKDQTMRRVPHTPGDTKLLELKVPGLAENRPSLIRGDSLLARIPGDNYYYRGYVHRVTRTTVHLGFYQRFVTDTHFNAQLYTITFGFNRHTLRTEHQAIELTRNHDIAKFFFPTELPPQRPLSNIQFVWYQTNIRNNHEQQQAVRHIFSGTSNPYPYLLFGPPGTGKTMTMVEAILQLWSLKPKSRILVAAPSNSAANEVTTRLIKYMKSKRDILRMISVSFNFDKVPEDMQPYCNRLEGEYVYPELATIEKYRIVIVTLTAAAKLIWGGITPGHFTHIFIDESGHSTESEVLIPIAGIVSSSVTPGQLLGQVVLAGDPKQLGPIIHSKLAKSFGYDRSMLERLMNTCSVYQKTDNSYNPNMVTKLLKNFRSHPEILKLPDEMFYDKELRAEGNDLSNLAIGWEELPNKNFPLIFHNVQGKDEREEGSPSYFNCKEIKVVMDYLKSLVGQRLKGREIKQSDIGIVSPYRKQVTKLQQECKNKNWNDILIGSVEQFQGQERLIIIVSTVRSKQELVEHDYKFHLGFLKNPKRFNVAVTRAKALVIIIGNPNILMWDEHWGRFIEYCRDNKALKGERFKFQQLWLQNEDAENNNDILNGSLEIETILNNISYEHADYSRGNI